MKNWRLRTRLIVAYVGLILVGFGGLALLAGHQITQGAMEDFERSLETQASLVARSWAELLESYADGEMTLQQLQTAVNETADHLNVRLTLVDINGKALLDSLGALPDENVRSDLEITAALAQNITRDVRTDEDGTAVIYTAAPVIEDGRIIAVVRVAVPEATALALIRQRQLALAGGVLLMIGLALMAALWLSASLTRPLESLRVSANRMAAGDFSQRPSLDRRDEIGQLAQAFNHMATQVDAMLTEQKAFAGNASHELRTPLTAIRLRSEALREGELDEETSQQYIAEIDDEVIRLGHLVNDLILLSRFDSGRAESGDDLIDPVRLARTIFQDYQSSAAAKNIDIKLNVATTLPPVQASQNHLHTVFHNLLENALKYTPNGGQITWHLVANGRELYSVLEDSGQGIAPEDLPHIFERFYRVDKAHARTSGGVGLGLSLTQSIVQFYNGRILIESDGLGQGTTVRVWWPFAPGYNEQTL